MSDEIYKPVRIDSKKALAKAKLRPGFTQAWDALEEEYAALEALLNARKTAGLNPIFNPQSSDKKRHKGRKL